MATKFASKACCVLLGLLAACPALAMEPGDLRDACSASRTGTWCWTPRSCLILRRSFAPC